VRVVITGGCGFLGRRVALHLLERSDVDELVLFDNMPSALPLPDDPRLQGHGTRCALAVTLAAPEAELTWTV